MNVILEQGEGRKLAFLANERKMQCVPELSRIGAKCFNHGLSQTERSQLFGVTFGLMKVVLWTPQSNSRFQESLMRFLGATGHSHLFPSRLPKQLQSGLRTDYRNKIKTGPPDAPILGAVLGSKSGPNTLSFRLLFRGPFLKVSGLYFGVWFGAETCVETPHK